MPTLKVAAHGVAGDGGEMAWHCRVTVVLWREWSYGAEEVSPELVLVRHGIRKTVDVGVSCL